MTFIPYHSGVPEEFRLPKELEVAARVAPPTAFLAPEAVELPQSLRAAELVGELAAFRAAAVPTLAVGAKFWVHLWTDQWAPNHRITIRCAQAGWTRDLFGEYRFGGWHFELSKSVFPQEIEMKFVLNGDAWMSGTNQFLSSGNNHHFSQGEINFPSSAGRFRVPYDNFVSETGQQQQRVLAANTNETVSYDAIVIGSGMGGGILSDALSDYGLKTLVLDAGGLVLPSHINNLPGDWESLPARHQVLNFENQDGSKFLFGVQMNLGGRSVFWSGLIPRMRDWEMIHWPVEVRDYLNSLGYDRAETVLRKRQTLGPFQDDLVKLLQQSFPDYLVEDLPRSRHQPNLDSGNQLVDVLEKSTGTFSTADLLLDSMAHEGPAGRDHLTINLNHLVTQIETQGGQAKAVICQDLVGNMQRRYQAKEIILCAGSLESPRIALQSHVADPAGKIGRGLTDHPAYFSREYSIPAHLPDGSPHPYGDPQRHAKIFLRHKQATSAEHAFNVEVLLNPWHWDARHPDDDLRKQRIGAQAQAVVKFTFIFESLLDDGNSLSLQGADKKLTVYVKPNPTGQPFHQECKQLRNALLCFLQVPHFDPDEDLGYGNQGTPHHAGGSLRMSDDHSGVVDENLKFESHDNLYACDVSVFPTIPCANPSLTLAALALRLADHLADKHGRRS